MNKLILSAIAVAAIALFGGTSGARINLAKHGADDGNGGVDPQPHGALVAKHGADDGNGGVDPKPHGALVAKHGADDGNGGVDPQPHGSILA